MPDRLRQGSGVYVERDFVAADLDAAFALLYVAEMRGLARDHAHALRAIEEAEKALGDGERRALNLIDSDRELVLPRFRRMRSVIQGIRSSLE
jgi:hypothetical protein